MQTRKLSKEALKEAKILMNDEELDLVSEGILDWSNFSPDSPDLTDYSNAESDGTGLQSAPRPGR